MSKVKVGIIGIGNMGSTHAKNLVDGKVANGELVAVCDINPARLDWAKTTFEGKVELFDDAEKMIKSGKVDAIMVATPHYFHPELAIKGFENGLHVLCEKPAGVYAKQVRLMNEKADKCDLKFSMMFNQRTNPVYQKARELIQSGEMGEIKRVNWIVTNWYRTQAYYNSGGWRATWSGEGGGVLVNQCPHNIDLLQWICGMPSKVTAFISDGKFHDIEVDDDVTAYFEFPNGANGVFITTTGEAPGVNRFEIACSKGSLIIEDGEIKYKRLRQDSQEFIQSATGGFDMPECWDVKLPITGEETAHVGIMNNWCDAIATGSELLASGTEGINGVRFANAMHLSAWLGKTVELPVDEDLFYEELQKKIKNSTFVKQEVKEAVVADMSSTYNSL